jgi:hypothetical protein
MRALALAALILVAPPAQGAFAQAQPAFEAKQEDVETLPDGPGRDETFYGCTACHNFSLVSAQGMTRRQWEDTVHLMVERHNMPELAEAEQKVMLDYLEKHYPPRTGRGGWRNPFAQ